ncbi:hypothetical protein [Reyranella sp.]|uniref:hypothetical protein n=1 Tax=Reyranella sp. TaxID=1929291 RepID=UPI003D133D8A
MKPTLKPLMELPVGGGRHDRTRVPPLVLLLLATILLAVVVHGVLGRPRACAVVPFPPAEVRR